jgi:hypothetical protein
MLVLKGVDMKVTEVPVGSAILVDKTHPDHNLLTQNPLRGSVAYVLLINRYEYRNYSSRVLTVPKLDTLPVALQNERLFTAWSNRWLLRLRELMLLSR